tara:strand:+ start:15492 stop:15683 length:192 start_codon:yes stop_codon:yes gene_type:complete
MFISCSSEDEELLKCIDESIIEEMRSCIEIYQPVCGCNGITYPNSCYATALNGITFFSDGECN